MDLLQCYPCAVEKPPGRTPPRQQPDRAEDDCRTQNASYLEFCRSHTFSRVCPTALMSDWLTLNPLTRIVKRVGRASARIAFG